MGHFWKCLMLLPSISTDSFLYARRDGKCQFPVGPGRKWDTSGSISSSSTGSHLSSIHIQFSLSVGICFCTHPDSSITCLPFVGQCIAVLSSIASKIYWHLVEKIQPYIYIFLISEFLLSILYFYFPWEILKSISHIS